MGICRRAAEKVAVILFFFSSRRRHTRCSRDWSSDVCSSDQWEGQNWKRSPGNLYGDPVKIAFDPTSRAPIKLVADKVIPAVQVPADDDNVKRIKIQSQILTKWWGHPIFLGATVLLPKDYDKHPDAHYPINYVQGHFSLGAPGGFGRGGAFDRLWLADGTPRFIYATLQHP